MPLLPPTGLGSSRDRRSYDHRRSKALTPTDRAVAQELEREHKEVLRATLPDFDALLASGRTVQLSQPSRRLELDSGSSISRSTSGSSEDEVQSTPVKASTNASYYRTTVTPPVRESSRTQADDPFLASPSTSSRAYPATTLRLGAGDRHGDRAVSDPITDTKRRSIFRTVGTASSPDLATLVRNAKEKRAAASASAVPPPPTINVSESSPEKGPVVRSRAKTDSPVLSPSPSHPTSLDSNPSSSPRLPTRDSFVHVPSDGPSESAQPSPPRSRRLPNLAGLSLDSAGSTPATDTYEFRSGPGAYDDGSNNVSSIPLVSVDSSDGVPLQTFQNTMRKTSGFFKKRFGTKVGLFFVPLRVQRAKKGGQSPGTPSLPGTPLIDVFSHSHSPPPPVPAIPDTYSQHSTPQSTPQKNQPGSQARTAPPVPQKQDKRNSLLPTENRRRSLSLTNALADLRRDKRPEGVNGNGGGEQERLRSELNSWSLDWDGVLAGLAKETSSNAKPPMTPPRFSSAPVTPQLVRTPREQAMARLTLSEKKPTAYSPSLAADASPSPNFVRSNAPSPFAPAELKPPSLSDRSSSTASRPHSFVSPMSSPSNLVVNGGRNRSASDLSPRISPLPSPLTHDDILHATPEKEPRYTTDLNANLDAPRADIGLGLGLETIREGHSRETSLATARDFPIDSPLVRQARANAELASTPDFSRSIPLLTTQSPSPSPLLNGRTPRPQPSPTRQKSRQSVVAYPGHSLVSPSPSIQSLGEGEHSTASLVQAYADESDEEEPAGLRSVTPGGTTLEERAEEQAGKIWNDDDTFLRREKVAEYLGKTWVLLCLSNLW